MKIAHITILSAAMLIAQPCFAAVDHRESFNPERRSAAFAGFNARLGFGTAKAEAPTARLKLGMTHSRTDRGSAAPGEFVQASGLELGLSGAAKPNLFIGGQSLVDVKKRLGFAGGNTTLLIVGGLAVAAAAVLLITSDGTSACIPEDLDCELD